MRSRRVGSLVWAAALLCCFVGSAGAQPPGSIEFVGENLFATARGTFHEWKVASARIDRADPAAGFVVVEVDVASLDTDNQRRDDHLRSSDFFEVERWPTATVRVHDARPAGRSEAGHPRYEARFDVRIRDVSKTLSGHFDVLGENPAHVVGEVRIDRTDFGVGAPYSRWNPMSIREEIPVRFSWQPSGPLPKP